MTTATDRHHGWRCAAARFSLGLSIWATKPNSQPQHHGYLQAVCAKVAIPAWDSQKPAYCINCPTTRASSQHGRGCRSFALHYQDEGRPRDARTFRQTPECECAGESPSPNCHTPEQWLPGSLLLSPPLLCASSWHTELCLLPVPTVKRSPKAFRKLQSD